MSYITKKMVVDLTEHMMKHRKKKILVEDYIRETGHDKEWSKQRKWINVNKVDTKRADT